MPAQRNLCCSTPWTGIILKHQMLSEWRFFAGFLGGVEQPVNEVLRPGWLRRRADPTITTIESAGRL